MYVFYGNFPKPSSRRLYRETRRVCFTGGKNNKKHLIRRSRASRDCEDDLSSFDGVLAGHTPETNTFRPLR